MTTSGTRLNPAACPIRENQPAQNPFLPSRTSGLPLARSVAESLDVSQSSLNLCENLLFCHFIACEPVLLL